jgi:UDP:flavonoid glycosyltransferase YjiC (YdhE family)
VTSGNSNTTGKYRYLFTTYPGFGHFHPVVPTALTLKDAGHEVAFAVARHFCPAVEQVGFEAFPAGRNGQNDPEFQELMSQLSQMPPGFESEMIIMGKVFASLEPRRLIPDMLAIAEKWKPDMIIREAAAYGGGITAEYLGLPQAAISPGAFLEGLQFFDQQAASELEGVRKQWGLRADPDGRQPYPYLLLNFTPPTFALSRPEPVYPPTAKFFRPQFYDRSGGENLPEWVNSLPDQPTVYVTLGTEVNHMPGFYPHVMQTILSGLRDEPYNLIVTLGRDKDPADFGPQPANVHIERYIPQTLLLPYVDLIVMHGGSNSLVLAIDQALSMVLIPLIADQFMNAQRCLELQLAPVIQLNQLTPATIRTATRQALQNKHYRENLRRLQTEMHNLPGLEQAVTLLEELAAKN